MVARDPTSPWASSGLTEILSTEALAQVENLPFGKLRVVRLRTSSSALLAPWARGEPPTFITP